MMPVTEQQIYANNSPTFTIMSNVFLFDPDNAYIISGKESFLHIIWQEILWLGTLLLLFLIFAGLFVHGTDKWLKVHMLNQSPSVAQGEVIRHRQTAAGSFNQSILYYITYQ